MPPPPDPGISPDRLIDLRGERCPYTFIKARLALEEMSTGEVLEVVLDFPPAFERVPMSLAILGHVLKGTWSAEGESRKFQFVKGSEPE